MLIHVPNSSHRHYPLYFFALTAALLITSVYWWHTRLPIFLGVPLLTLFLPHRYTLLCFFFGMALYCAVLEVIYQQKVNIVRNFPVTGILHVNTLDFNTTTRKYRIAGSFYPNTSAAPTSTQIFVKEQPQCKPADFIKIRLQAQAPYNSSYRLYLRKEGIHAVSFLKTIKGRVVNHISTFWHRLQGQVSRCEEHLKKHLSVESFILISSLFLGSKKYQENTSIQNYFNQWGINHFLARSGLHITLVLGILAFIARIFSLSLSTLYAISVLFLGMLFFLSYPTISFIRAVLSSLLLIACFGQKRPAHFLPILLIALITLILYNPLSLFFLDFQLTFLLTFALAFLSL